MWVWAVRCYDVDVTALRWALRGTQQRLCSPTGYIHTNDRELHPRPIAGLATTSWSGEGVLHEKALRAKGSGGEKR